jgi:hypothetical protein
MTSSITTTREAMAELVGTATGAQAHAFMPGRIVPPAVIVLPGTPYLASSGTFGTFALGLEVVLVASANVNETGATTLDQLVDDAVVALVNAGLSVSEVSEPWQLSSGNASYLAATITTTQPVTL